MMPCYAYNANPASSSHAQSLEFNSIQTTVFVKEMNVPSSIINMISGYQST